MFSYVTAPNGGGLPKKTCRNRKEAGLSRQRNKHIYQVIKEEHEEHHYSFRSLCKLGGITRAAYYKWLNRIETANDRLNKQISDRLEAIHQEHPDMGYRRLNDKLRHDTGIKANDKRILRICRKQQIRSNLKYRYDVCTRPSKNPAFIVTGASNILPVHFTKS